MQTTFLPTSFLISLPLQDLYQEKGRRQLICISQQFFDFLERVSQMKALLYLQWGFFYIYLFIVIMYNLYRSGDILVAMHPIPPCIAYTKFWDHILSLFLFYFNIFLILLVCLYVPKKLVRVKCVSFPFPSSSYINLPSPV